MARRSQGAIWAPCLSSARNVEVACHGGGDPGNLLALGALLDACPHGFERDFNIPPGDRRAPTTAGP